MLPTATDNGGRLAAILPTGIAALALGNARSPQAAHDALIAAAGLAPGLPAGPNEVAAALPLIPALHSLVVVVVDGLGSANLKARAGHAPTVSSLQQRRITTVTPSTTAAALTTLTTGRLPAEHGLIGYRIMHPELGLLSPLRDWEGISDTREWQRAAPLFEHAEALGLRARAYGRPAHAESGLTRAILRGADYSGGDRIAERFAAARRDLAGGEPTLAYLYVDELDRAGHQHGWQSEAWSSRLEQLDLALADFMTGLPSETGLVVTADHGMVDVAAHQHIVFDLGAPEFAEVRAFGGEPRFRSFYLTPEADPRAFAERLRALEGRRAWVATRDEVFAAGLFGTRVSPGVRERVGDVLLAARSQCAYYATSDEQSSFELVGQHGSWTDEERGIPLLLGGALAGTGFAKAVELVAAAATAS
ncbi:nucleotide pyrophosphatase/phosphodiesterase family protein [Leucobacter albus]|uniref:Nucleotide pyrophosphatase/phosphodiesterase family protein n=1 Tax=Leucobacter albus TaxID=272210 RepID=A0ABW3TKT5_9MICO